MIIGTHPHVMEDIEKYNGKTIVYSLGNFIFDQYFSKDTMRGMFFSATYDGTNLIKTEQKIITLNKYYQPEGIFSPEEIKQKLRGPKSEEAKKNMKRARNSPEVQVKIRKPKSEEWKQKLRKPHKPKSEEMRTL